MEDITDAYCAHTKRVFKNIKIKNLVEHHDLHLQSDTFLLADDDLLENFRNTCIEIYDLNLTRFLTVSGLAWKSAKEVQSKIRSIN